MVCLFRNKLGPPVCNWKKIFTLTEFDADSSRHLRMTLLLGRDGQGLVGFSAVQENEIVRDLGVAFVNLPEVTWVAAATPSGGGQEATVRLSYIAGPEGKTRHQEVTPIRLNKGFLRNSELDLRPLGSFGAWVKSKRHVGKQLEDLFPHLRT